MRIDRLLVDRGLASSRNQAQELLDAGRVVIVRDGKETVIKKASQVITDHSNSEIRVLPSLRREFVSRGGIKLQGALEHTGLNVGQFVALDVGLSTGGFTDCLLQSGVSRVIGLDVGHGQLAAKLKDDPRLLSLEGINARDLRSSRLKEVAQLGEFDLAVIDVSFISLRLVLPEVVPFLKNAGVLLALVKPQFEVGREGLGKNGIVKDASLFNEVREKITTLCQDLDLSVEDYFASSIDGSDGNKEFFVLARKSAR